MSHQRALKQRHIGYRGQVPRLIIRRTTPNYAIKPTPEQALRTIRTQSPARLIAALDVRSSGGSRESVSGVV